MPNTPTVSSVNMSVPEMILETRKFLGMNNTIQAKLLFQNISDRILLLKPEILPPLKPYIDEITQLLLTSATEAIDNIQWRRERFGLAIAWNQPLYINNMNIAKLLLNAYEMLYQAILNIQNREEVEFSNYELRVLLEKLQLTFENTPKSRSVALQVTLNLLTQNAQPGLDTKIPEGIKTLIKSLDLLQQTIRYFQELIQDKSTKIDRLSLKVNERDQDIERLSKQLEELETWRKGQDELNQRLKQVINNPPFPQTIIPSPLGSPSPTGSNTTSSAHDLDESINLNDLPLKTNLQDSLFIIPTESEQGDETDSEYTSGNLTPNSSH